MRDKHVREIGFERSATSDESRAKLATAARRHQRATRIRRLFSLDRADFWRMPRWFWLPLVTALVV
ncbi:hypothetical protein, partial [Proteus faecis]|uniref:hypothetical protein n=1 Tax=Proteus faecis TaxID=2050967 RepID=UPI003075DACD